MNVRASDSIADVAAPLNRAGDADDSLALDSTATTPTLRSRLAAWWKRRWLTGDMWDDTGSMTVIVPLRRACVKQVREHLAEVDRDIRNNVSPLKAVQGLHVARWVVLPERVRGRGALTEPSLVMWTVHDGSRDEHVSALATHAWSLLGSIYGTYADFPSGTTPDAPALKRFFAAHEARGRVASFVGTPGVTVENVTLQQRLVEDELVPFARKRRAELLPNHHIFLAMQDFIHDRRKEQISDSALSKLAKRRPGTRRIPNLYLDLVWNLLRSRNTLGAVIVFGAAITALGYWWQVGTGILGAPAFMLVTAFGLAGLALTGFGFSLRNAEKREAGRYIRASDRELRDLDDQLQRRDNEGAGMNRVTILTDLKPGWARQITLRFVLWLIAFRTSRNFEGALEGIESIHFAQWRIVDRGRRLMFMSNYDGQAVAYFREFAENSAPGVNAIWGNTEGMPNTTAVIGEGSRNLEEFENAARVHQTPTDAWYCGYAGRRLTTATINDNWRIHRLLHEHPTPSQVDEWMALLERYGV